MKILTFIASLLLASLADVHAAEASKPNIVFILTDDQGYGDVGRHGHPLLKTPNMDALHDQSVRFEKFYVSPSCSPTRAALMTGMHEFRNGVTHTTDPREHLNKDAVILPQLLKSAGYRTGFIGKWHLGNDGDYAPDKRGFDWTSFNMGAATVHFDPVIVRNRKREQRKGYREDILFDEAMTFIDENKAGPFFCYLATYSPHAPVKSPDEFKAPFVGKVDAEAADYLGMVANLDYNLGRLMKHLRDRGQAENTIVIFMNDNGATHGLDVYNAGMRGSKATIWQGGSRAMSFWSWPGKWQPHAVRNLTAHLDVLPTLCEYAGVKLPADLGTRLEGFSLRPLLESSAPISWHDDRLLFHHVGRWPSGLAAAHKHAMASVQTGDYLLVRSRPCDDPACKRYSSQCTTLRSVEAGATKATYTKANAQLHWGVTPPGRWSLFDLKNDILCKQDLAAQKPELASKLAAAYDQWWDTLFPTMIQLGGDKGEPDSLKKGQVEK
ncbi:arylsulfatase [Verrucomicrobiota bacterium]|nr:arylsulfatase [Verrucomicrobiota bacterium]